MQSTQYYPFGMAFAEGTTATQGKQPFKYNGKELDQSHGLNWYDYSARQLDNAYGRFTSVDPHAENYYSWSPYVYVGNNPMRLVDPDGKDWFVNNENGNMFYLKGVSELTDKQREQYNLGSAEYEKLGQDGDFGYGMEYGTGKDHKGKLLDQEFVAVGVYSEELMNRYGYDKAQKVTVKETETVLGGRMGNENIKQYDYKSERIGEIKITYARPGKMDQKTIIENFTDPYKYSRTHVVTYETTVPVGTRPTPYFAGQSSGSDASTALGILDGVINVLKGLFGK